MVTAAAPSLTLGAGTVARGSGEAPAGALAEVAAEVAAEVWDAPALRGARIELFDDLRALEDLWRRATRRCACTVFQTYDWLAAWRETCPAPRTSDAIVHVAGRDGATLMLLPLGVSRRYGGRCLEFLGADLCDYNAPVIDRALAETMSRRDVERLRDHLLARLPRVDWLHLRRMPPRVDGVRNPLAELDCRPGELAFAATLPGSFEAFVARRSRGFFAQNRRHRRRLEGEGAVAFALPEDPEERLALLRFTVERKAAWQRSLGLPPTFGGRGGRAAFYERLTRTLPPDAEPETEPDAELDVVVTGLLVDGRTVAGLWGVVFRNRFLFLVTSYDPGWAAFRVGRLLMEDVVRACIGRGLAVFDLTTGDEAYKTSWADATTPVLDHLAARTLLGAGVLRLRDAGRRLARSRAGGRLAALHRRWRAHRAGPNGDPNGGSNEGGTAREPVRE